MDERGEAGGGSCAGEGVSHTSACASVLVHIHGFLLRIPSNADAAPPALALGLAHSCEMHTDREREKKGVRYPLRR